jgi:hypothetical protein
MMPAIDTLTNKVIATMSAALVPNPGHTDGVPASAGITPGRIDRKATTDHRRVRD